MAGRVAAVVITLALLVGCAFFAVNLFASLRSPTRIDVVDSEGLSMPEGVQVATVNYVHDGDTLFLATPADQNLKVRLLSIDAPEVGENLEHCGDEATAYLRTLAPEGSTVYTLADEEPLDQYGRSLLYVWTESGKQINEALVRNGYARPMFVGKNHLYKIYIEAARDAAQDSSVGIWAAC